MARPERLTRHPTGGSLERFESDEAHMNYLALHLIPAIPALWEMDRFEDFIAARQELILEKFKHMIQNAQEVPA